MKLNKEISLENQIYRRITTFAMHRKLIVHLKSQPLALQIK